MDIYNIKLSRELTQALIKDNRAYIENTLKKGTSFEKFIIHHFYGEIEEAAKELKIVLATTFKNINAENTIQNTDYLYYSTNKLFEKYQERDWFKKEITIRKEVYDYVRKQFPRAEEVLAQIKH